MTKSLLLKLNIYFGVIGLFIAAYMLYLYEFSLPIPCSNHGCDTVRNSEYAKMFSIPVPAYGVAFYLTVLGLSIYCLKNPRHLFSNGLLLLTLSGFAYSVYLTYLEIYVIEAICNWCVASAVVSTILAVIMVVFKLKERKS